MAKDTRIKIIKDIEKERGDRVCIAYVTSTRAGQEVQIADDVVRRLFDHLEANKERAKARIL